MAGYQASATRPMTARVRFFTGLFFVVLAAVMAEAVRLQVFMRDDLERRAHDQYLRELSLAPRRGAIVESSVAVDPDWPWLRDCNASQRWFDETACLVDERHPGTGNHGHEASE